MVYSTFIGGSEGDYLTDIAVDKNCASFVTGYTYSDDYRVINSDSSYHGQYNEDIVLTSLNPTGEFNFSAFIGSDGNERALSIAIDSNNSVFLTGHTESSNFPTNNSYGTDFNALADGYVMKYNTAGLGYIEYSSLIGTNVTDMFSEIAVDVNGLCYIAGTTTSSSFPVVNPFDDTLDYENEESPRREAVIFVLDPFCYQPPPEEPPKIPGYDLTILLGIFFIGLIGLTLKYSFKLD